MDGLNDLLHAIGGKRLNADQEQAVRTLDDNVIVSAGAGSGKTMVLSLRFLWLLMEKRRGEKPVNCDNILTLTFTRKAAAEMKERIHAYMGKAASDGAKEHLSDGTRAFFREQLEKYWPGAAVGTLDSFYAQVAKASPYAYAKTGIIPDFSVDTTGEVETRMARSVARMLKEEDNAGARVLLSQGLAPDELSQILARHAVRDFPVIPDVSQADEESFLAPYRDYFLQRKEDICRSLSALLEECADPDPPPRTNSGLFKLMQLLNTDRRWSAGQKEDFSDFVLGTLLPFVEGWSSLPKGCPPEIMKQPKAFRTLSQEILDASGTDLSEDCRQVLLFYRRVAIAAQKTKRETGMLGFDDIAALGRWTLLAYPDVRRTFGEKYRYIMVDEFQDNNKAQQDFLFLLAAKKSWNSAEGQEIPRGEDLEKKLFFVGDDKQSIYRFRGADVTVFKGLSQTLKGQSTAISLGQNYRSEPRLINAFRTLFSSPAVMGPGRPDKLPWEASFDGISGGREESGNSTSVTVIGRPRSGNRTDTDDAKSSESQAYAVAEKIREILDDGGRKWTKRGPDGTKLPIRPEDIAILMPKGPNQMQIEPTLRLHGIPYTIVSEPKSLMHGALAGDFYSLLELLVYPDDSAAYAAVLRSPFCQMDDITIGRILAVTKHRTLEEKEEGRHDVFDPSLADEIDALSGPAGEKWRKICAFFAKWRADAAALTIPELLDEAWIDSGYRLHYLARAERQPFVEQYTYFSKLAETAQDRGLSIAEFVAWVRQRLGSQSGSVAGGGLTEDDNKILWEKATGVQLMTIHKSKGLEFPVVFVIGLGSSDGGNRDKNKKLFLPGEGKLWIPPMTESIGDVLDDSEEKSKATAEKRRVLYVAATRAEQHLFFVGEGRAAGGKAQDTMFDWVLAGFGIPVEGDGYGQPDPALGVRVENFEPVSEDMFHASHSSAAPSVGSGVARLWYDGAEKRIAARNLARGRMGVTSFIPEVKEEEGVVRLPDAACDSLLGSSDIEETGEGEPDTLTTDWGTYVHAYVMNAMGLLDGDVSAVPLPGQFGLLKDEERELLFAATRKMSSDFLSSSFYKTEVEPFLATAKAEADIYFRPSALGEKKPEGLGEEDWEDLVLNGSIDVLVHRPETEEWDVLDFKTDRTRSPSRHKDQVRLYLRAVKALHPEGKVFRGAIIYLRDPENVVWWSAEDLGIC